MTTKKVEWVGAITQMAPPADVEDAAPADVLAFLAPGGPLLFLEMNAPDALLADAATHLRSAIERPLSGPAHAPTSVRLSTDTLADALRAALPDGITLTVGPTPEVEAALEIVRATVHVVPSFLPADVDPDVAAAFFRATAALHRAKPWNSVPDDENLFLVTIERFGLRDAPVSIIGQNGEAFGLLLFRNEDDYEAYLEAAAAIHDGEEPAFPPHVAITFDQATDVEAALRAEIEARGWEIAAPDAYAMITMVENGGAIRAAHPEEITMVESLALAFTALIEPAEPLRQAYEKKEPFERTFTVASALGPVEVTLAVSRPEQDDDVLLAFEASPEGEPIVEPKWAMLLSDVASHAFNATVTTVTPVNLREFLEDIVVRRVGPPPTMAAEIITELCAFYTFLKRTEGTDRVDPHLALLGPEATKKLETALVTKARPRTPTTKAKKEERKAQRNARKRSR